MGARGEDKGDGGVFMFDQNPKDVKVFHARQEVGVYCAGLLGHRGGAAEIRGPSGRPGPAAGEPGAEVGDVRVRVTGSRGLGLGTPVTVTRPDSREVGLNTWSGEGGPGGPRWGPKKSGTPKRGQGQSLRKGGRGHP